MAMSRRKRLLVFAPFAIVGIVLFAFIGGSVVQWLWNWLTPPLFGLPQITFWQALGLLALSRILFGGLGVGPLPLALERDAQLEVRLDAARIEQKGRPQLGLGLGIAPRSEGAVAALEPHGELVHTPHRKGGTKHVSSLASHSPRSVGSSRSRSPSPVRLTTIEVSINTMPGKVEIHHAESR